MTTSRIIAGAFCLTVAAAAPAFAQSPQEAQRNLFICMQKANNLELKDEKKQEFIAKCAEDPGKPVETGKDKDKT